MLITNLVTTYDPLNYAIEQQMDEYRGIFQEYTVEQEQLHGLKFFLLHKHNILAIARK